MNIIKLKSCPFCGAPARMKDRHLLAAEIQRGGIVIPMVLCSNDDCGATCGPVLRYPKWRGMSFTDLEQIAVDAWNARAGEVQA